MPGSSQLDDAGIRADVGQVVSSIGEDDVAARRVEDGEQAGHEHPRRHLGDEQFVGSGQDLARGVGTGGFGTQDRVGPGHDQRRRHALVGDIADRDADAPAGHLDEVVEVATDRASRAVVGGDLPLRQVRELAWQELLLDERRDAHLLFHALALGGLVGLLADKLRDADGGRRLRGEGRQEAAVVGRVVLFGQARTKVEGADQLALRDERDDQGDAGLAEGVDRR